MFEGCLRVFDGCLKNDSGVFHKYQHLMHQCIVYNVDVVRPLYGEGDEGRSVLDRYAV